MIKKLSFIGVLALLLGLAPNALAVVASGQQGSGQQGNQAQVQTIAEPVTATVQSQGEQQQVQTQVQAQTRTETGTVTETPKKTQATVQTNNAEQTRSEVANAVQTMLQVADRSGGIGEQVRVIAQNQNQNEEKLNSSLDKIQNRNKISRFLFGSDYQEIKEAKKVLQQNREQVEQLNQLKSQIANAGDAQTLTEQIRVLEQSNNQVENSLNESENNFSLFGWLVKLFVK